MQHRKQAPRNTSVHSWQSLYTLRGIHSDVRLHDARCRCQTVARVCPQAPRRRSRGHVLHGSCTGIQQQPSWRSPFALSAQDDLNQHSRSLQAQPDMDWQSPHMCTRHKMAAIISLTHAAYAAPRARTVNLRSWHSWPTFQGKCNMRCHTLIRWPPCPAPARYGRVPAITEPMCACCKALHLTQVPDLSILRAHLASTL